MEYNLYIPYNIKRGLTGGTQKYHQLSEYEPLSVVISDLLYANYPITLPSNLPFAVRKKAPVSPHSPVGHIQEKCAAGWVKLKSQQPLKLGNEDVFVRGAHAAELLHELRIHVHVRALH